MSTTARRTNSSAQPANSAWWKKFLTPGWVITAVLIIIFSYFAFSFLAPWQLGKDDAIVERNERIAQAFEVDPVPVTDIVAPDGTWDRDNEWTRVTLTGQYQPDDEVLLRLRPVDSIPAFHGMVPFELDNGQTILVNRGWVEAIDGTQVPDFAPAPSTPVTITGLIRVDEGVHHSPPLEDQGYTQVYSINTEQISSLIDEDLAAPWIQLLPDEAGLLNAQPLPQLDRGNHLSYGLQWIAFGVMAPLGLLYFISAEFKERRRVKEEEAELAGIDAAPSAGPDPHPENDEAPAQDKAMADNGSRQAQRMRNRYGDSRRNHWARNTQRDEERF